MSIKVNLAQIFKTSSLKHLLSADELKEAKKFLAATKRGMLKQGARGRVYNKTGIFGLKRRHRASARGQYPAPDTKTLVNALDIEKAGDKIRIVVKSKRNIASGGDTKIYAEHLVRMGRQIFLEKEIRTAEKELVKEIERTIRKLS